MVGLKDRGKRKLEFNSIPDPALAEELIRFYVRFDTHNTSNRHSELKEGLLASPPFTPSFNEQSVVRCFKHCNPKKSPGPDNISGCTLKVCAEQLGPIFYYIFSVSLTLQAPSLWKQSVVVPVTKVSRPQTLNDFRPVALTSPIAKSLEKLIKAELLIKVEPLLDPYQFAYRAKRGVQDATITLLNLLYKHLEKNGNHARLLFADFSSAFNTIQPHLLTD